MNPLSKKNTVLAALFKWINFLPNIILDHIKDEITIPSLTVAQYWLYLCTTFI